MIQILQVCSAYYNEISGKGKFKKFRFMKLFCLKVESYWNNANLSCIIVRKQEVFLIVYIYRKHRKTAVIRKKV